MIPKWFAVMCLLAIYPVVATAQAHQLVDVGGHRLDLLRAGSGAPSAIFQAPLSWSHPCFSRNPNPPPASH